MKSTFPCIYNWLQIIILKGTYFATAEKWQGMRYMFNIGINFPPFYPSLEELSQFYFMLVVGVLTWGFKRWVPRSSIWWIVRRTTCSTWWTVRRSTCSTWWTVWRTTCSITSGTDLCTTFGSEHLSKDWKLLISEFTSFKTIITIAISPIATIFTFLRKWKKQCQAILRNYQF